MDFSLYLIAIVGTAIVGIYASSIQFRNEAGKITGKGYFTIGAVLFCAVVQFGLQRYESKQHEEEKEELAEDLRQLKGLNGGDSYPLVTFDINESDAFEAWCEVKGDFWMHEIDVTVLSFIGRRVWEYDLEEIRRDVKQLHQGLMSKHFDKVRKGSSKRVGRGKVLKGGRFEFIAHVTALNGEFIQRTVMKKVGGKWLSINSVVQEVGESKGVNKHADREDEQYFNAEDMGIFSSL